jgi:hypothetical protein
MPSLLYACGGEIFNGVVFIKQLLLTTESIVSFFCHTGQTIGLPVFSYLDPITPHELH